MGWEEEHEKEAMALEDYLHPGMLRDSTVPRRLSCPPLWHIPCPIESSYPSSKLQRSLEPN